MGGAIFKAKKKSKTAANVGAAINAFDSGKKKEDNPHYLAEEANGAGVGSSKDGETDKGPNTDDKENKAKDKDKLKEKDKEETKGGKVKDKDKGKGKGKQKEEGEGETTKVVTDEKTGKKKKMKRVKKSKSGKGKGKATQKNKKEKKKKVKRTIKKKVMVKEMVKRPKKDANGQEIPGEFEEVEEEVEREVEEEIEEEVDVESDEESEDESDDEWEWVTDDEGEEPSQPKEPATEEEIEAAAVKIQAQIRGRQVRQRNKEEKEREEAAIRIQCATRQKQAKNEAERMKARKARRERGQMVIRWQTQAVTGIQANVRGFLTRRQLEQEGFYDQQSVFESQTVASFLSGYPPSSLELESEVHQRQRKLRGKGIHYLKTASLRKSIDELADMTSGKYDAEEDDSQPDVPAPPPMTGDEEGTPRRPGRRRKGRRRMQVAQKQMDVEMETVEMPDDFLYPKLWTPPVRDEPVRTSKHNRTSDDMDGNGANVMVIDHNDDGYDDEEHATPSASGKKKRRRRKRRSVKKKRSPRKSPQRQTAMYSPHLSPVMMDFDGMHDDGHPDSLGLLAADSAHARTVAMSKSKVSLMLHDAINEGDIFDTAVLRHEKEHNSRELSMKGLLKSGYSLHNGNNASESILLNPPTPKTSQNKKQRSKKSASKSPRTPLSSSSRAPATRNHVENKPYRNRFTAEHLGQKKKEIKQVDINGNTRKDLFASVKQVMTDREVEIAKNRQHFVTYMTRVDTGESARALHRALTGGHSGIMESPQYVPGSNNSKDYHRAASKWKAKASQNGRARKELKEESMFGVFPESAAFLPTDSDSKNKAKREKYLAKQEEERLLEEERRLEEERKRNEPTEEELNQHAINVQRMVRGHLARRNIERAGGLSLRNIDDVVEKANKRAEEARQKANQTQFKKDDQSLDISKAEMFRDPKMAERQQQKKLDQLEERRKKKEKEEEERKKREEEEKEAAKKEKESGSSSKHKHKYKKHKHQENGGPEKLEVGLFSNKQMEVVKRQRRDSVAGGAATRRRASTISRGGGNTLLGALSEEGSGNPRAKKNQNQIKSEL